MVVETVRKCQFMLFVKLYCQLQERFQTVWSLWRQRVKTSQIWPESELVTSNRRPKKVFLPEGKLGFLRTKWVFLTIWGKWVYNMQFASYKQQEYFLTRGQNGYFLTPQTIMKSKKIILIFMCLQMLEQRTMNSHPKFWK